MTLATSTEIPATGSRCSTQHPALARSRTARWARDLSPLSAAIGAAALVVAVTAIDWVTGPDASCTLLYLAPVAFATWFVTCPGAFLASLACATLSCWVDVATRNVPLPPAMLAWNLAVQLGVFLAVAAILSTLKSHLELEKQLARTDPLTLIANRRAFLSMAEVELERARRGGGPMTVAYLDADDFKRVNDRMGHSQGDALLVTAARTLRSETRATDIVARLGGDEFGLLLVDTDGPTAEALVQRLRRSLAAAMSASGWDTSFSVGAVTFIDPPRSLDEMLTWADQLMYDAKHSGKGAARLAVVGRPPASTLDLAAS